jgi:hypothetical protein
LAYYDYIIVRRRCECHESTLHVLISHHDVGNTNMGIAKTAEL